MDLLNSQHDSGCFLEEKLSMRISSWASSDSEFWLTVFMTQLMMVEFVGGLCPEQEGNICKRM